MIRAVHCKEFAALTSSSGDAKKPRFQPRQPAPKRLREVLTLEWIPRPTLSSNKSVLIQVHYAGIQYPDSLQAQGLYQVRPPLPYIPAMDATGVVVEVASGVKGIQVGDRVMATMLQHGGTGGMAEIIEAPSWAVFSVPDNLELSKCSNIARNYFAAYHTLKVIGQIDHKSLVLIDGASGGVGMAAIELAKAMGSKVIAGVSSPSKMEGPKSVGADVVLCYGKDAKSYKAFKTQVRQAAKTLGHAQGVDLVVDMVQGDLFEKALLSCVRPLGTIALVGFAAGQKPIRPGLLLVKEVNVVGSLWGRWSMQHPKEHGQNVHQILNCLASGAIRPRVDRVFPLQEFAQAFELYETNQGRGNTVVSFLEGQDGTHDKLMSRL